MTTTPPTRWNQSPEAPDNWVAAAEDPREALPKPVGEKQTLAYYLKLYRMTLEMKCEGLDAEQMARRSVPPSNMSLLGMVRHMAAVENNWFQHVLQQRHDAPRLYDVPDDDDHDWNGAAGESAVVEEAWTAWRNEVAAAEAWFDALPEEDLGRTVPRRGEELAVRDIIVHMIEEYARHAGHADLLREAIDGRVGQ